MQHRRTTPPNRLYKKLQKLRPMHRQLRRIPLLRRINSKNLRTGIVPAKRKPDSIPVTGNLPRFIQKPDLAYEFCCVGPDAYPGADLFVFGGLLVDVDLDLVWGAVVVDA